MSFVIHDMYTVPVVVLCLPCIKSLPVRSKPNDLKAVNLSERHHTKTEIPGTDLSTSPARQHNGTTGFKFAIPNWLGH